MSAEQPVQKSETAKREEEVLAFWNEKNIFKKSLEKDAPNGEYVFYDGPPFATGTPHYGHIVASLIKDVVPRYWTMRGYRVPRQWGWDCHGLPIENIVEKELGTKHKKDVVAMGVAKFNELCRSKVLMYVDEWKKVIPRIGRWADMENPYFTMSPEFMESVWWAFKQLYDKGLVYEDYRSMYICPRCETTLSQSEVAEGYKDIKDLSVIAKFKVKNPEKYGLPKNTFILAWTTTPWTLPGNVALAVGNNVLYELIKEKGAENYYLLADERIDKLHIEYETDSNTQGRDWAGRELIGVEYEPLFDSYASDPKLKNRENGWKVYAGDFVSTDEGTGVVHIAPAFGADDMALGKQYNLPFVQHLGMDGIIYPEVKELAGRSVKPIDDIQSTDVEVIKILAGKGLLFSKEKYEHSYPHCWRCDTPLINYATSSWFVKIESQKEALLENAKPINWSPEHIKEGRWGKWLEGARDWSISRQRFWASVIPIWRCEKCKEIQVFGSVAELEKASGKKVNDLHKHIVDDITFPCACGGTMKRIPDVLDTWFDSGSMSYAQRHYPFENKEQFEKTFPAQFIAEGQDQCRAWFYYLHVLATSIFDSNAFENVIVNGIVLAEDGKKMSKRLQNYPDPMYVVDKYGADALRMYLLSSPVMLADNLNFSEKGVAEWKGVLTRLENVLSFYKLYEKDGQHEPSTDSTNVLDRWILARLAETQKAVTDSMNGYNLVTASRPFALFIDDLSTWYLRRSRERIKGDNEADKKAALATTLYVLRETARIIAPFAPFMADRLWLELKQPSDVESIHLADWPAVHVEPDHGVLADMEEMRSIVTAALEAREKAGIKVRQPLASLTISGDSKLAQEYCDIIADEVNVKDILKKGAEIALDTNISVELKEEGIVRDVSRAVQQKRKEAGLQPHDPAVITVHSHQETIDALRKHEETFKRSTKTADLVMKTNEDLASANDKLLIEVRKLERQVSNAQRISIALAIIGGISALIFGFMFK